MAEQRNARDVRIEVYTSYKKLFANAPIRLWSKTVADMRSKGYDDLASAIGDMDWQTVPADDPEDPTLRHDWSCMLADAFGDIESWMHKLGPKPLGYNLDSVGYPDVTSAWSAMWKHQLGIELVNRPQETPQVYIFHGGNHAMNVAFLAVAEARRDRLKNNSTPTMLVAVPTFTCPLDQLALLGMNTWLLPPVDPGMVPSPADLAQVPEGTEIDGLYLLPISNPTGRTVPPAQLKAFLDEVLRRWPRAGIVLDSVYVRLHPDYRDLLSWYNQDPRYRESVVFVDSLSKTHGVTGLRAGALLTASEDLSKGILRYAQNIMAGPANTVQAVILALLDPFVTGDPDLAEQRAHLGVRIGKHMQRRRKLLLQNAFTQHRALLHEDQPVLEDATTYDWPGSMYADLQLSDHCRQLAREQGFSSSEVFYFETGIAGVPLNGFCRNQSLERHGLILNQQAPELLAFQQRASNFVRLSFGLTPPPRV